MVDKIGEPSSKRPRWSPGAFALAGATALVATTAAWVPALPSGAGGFLDAVINEWIIWFTALYLAALAVVSVVERLPHRARVFSHVNDDG